MSSGANGPGRTKDLKQIIKELEESDYGGYGSWGNFRIRREYRDKKMNSKYPSGGPGDYHVVEMDDPNQPPSSASERETQLVRNPSSSAAVDYYRPQSSSEFVMLLERANILKHPSKKYSKRKIVTIASFVKLSIMAAIVSAAAYLSVSPRHLGVEEYNAQYKANLLRVAMSYIWPLLLLARVFRFRDADINLVVGTLFKSFVLYYPLVCLIEKVLATFVRLAIIRAFEPGALQLCSSVPGWHLPWVLPQHKYYPKRSTLFMFLVANACVTAPVVEEVFKSRVLSGVIYSISQACRGASPAEGPETVPSKQPAHPPVSVRTVVVYMLALTTGLKLADNTRRILLYTAPQLKHKDFFAVARSVYPVQELGGMLAALNLAKGFFKGDAVKGSEEDPDAKATTKKPRRHRGGFPYRSILLHAMATMRGMKPLFVWDSRRPWDEVQLQAWNAVDSRSPGQLVAAGVLNFLWFAALYKYLQVVLKKYFTLSQEYYRKKQEEAFFSLAKQRQAESQSLFTSRPPTSPDSLDQPALH